MVDVVDIVNEQVRHSSFKNQTITNAYAAAHNPISIDS